MFGPFGRHAHPPFFGMRHPFGPGAFFERMRHQGPDSDWPGAPTPPFGPFGRRFGFAPPATERFFGRGDLKYVILDLFRDQPRHGYDVIRTLEERFQGFYTPSAGSVYPTLQLLEDQGYLTVAQQEGKKVYAITEAGRQALAEQQATLDEMRERMSSRGGPGRHGHGPSPEMGELFAQVRDLGRFMFVQGKRGALHDPAKMRQLREVVRRARTEIEAIFNAPAPATETGATTTFV